MTVTDELTWTDAFLVGYPPMDQTHHEFVDIVGSMLGAADEAIPALLQQLIDHSVQHFQQEQDWMARTNFPATECHTNEHDAVLKSIREVQSYLQGGGSCDEARRLATELARWFPGHTDYLDASLAQWVSKKQLGGVPIVVRRGVAYNESE